MGEEKTDKSRLQQIMEELRSSRHTTFPEQESHPEILSGPVEPEQPIEPEMPSKPAEPEQPAEPKQEVYQGPCGMYTDKCPGPQYKQDYVPADGEDDCIGCTINPKNYDSSENDASD